MKDCKSDFMRYGMEVSMDGSMNINWLTQAVYNNADWCNAIANSHSIDTYRDESVWCCAHPMPKFYPNLITLKSDAEINNEINRLAKHLASGWGIKDSFCNLNLEGMGFKIAFTAQWYCCLPSQHRPLKPSINNHVKTVNNDSDFYRWAAAWGNEKAIFKHSLMNNSAIKLFYVEQHGEIVAGMATNSSEHCVGISNLFGRQDHLLDCVAAVIDKHARKAIVGYGDKAETDTLSKVGFEAIGDLRVWLYR